MAILVDNGNFLLNINYYVVSNPMKFKSMVCCLEGWFWRGCLAMIADSLKLGWLATDWLLYMMKPERSGFSGFIVTKKSRNDRWQNRCLGGVAGV